MHLPDGFVAAPVNAACGLLALGAVALAARRAGPELARRPHLTPLLGASAAVVFAAQTFNFPIGGGTSGHFLGAGALAALLGPCSACLVMAAVVTLQCLGFADGGVTALGTNVVNMGLLAVAVSWAVARGLVAALPRGRASFVASAALASGLGVVAAALACALELALSGTSPLAVAAPAMLSVHLFIGAGEALVTAALLVAVLGARPELEPAWATSGSRAPALVGLGAAVALAVLAGPLASNLPDGLERVAADLGFEGSATTLWAHAPFPDYALPGAAAGGASASLAGLAGTAAAFAAGYGVLRWIRAARSS